MLCYMFLTYIFCGVQERVNKPLVQELLQVELLQVLLCSLLPLPLASLGGVAGGPLKPSLMFLVSTRNALKKDFFKLMPMF